MQNNFPNCKRNEKLQIYEYANALVRIKSAKCGGEGTQNREALSLDNVNISSQSKKSTTVHLTVTKKTAIVVASATTRRAVCYTGEQSVEQDALLDRLAADGALGHAVATHLASPMTAQEDHVLETVQAHWAHGLFFNVLQLLLKLLKVVDRSVVRAIVHQRPRPSRTIGSRV